MDSMIAIIFVISIVFVIVDIAVAAKAVMVAATNATNTTVAVKTTVVTVVDNRAEADAVRAAVAAVQAATSKLSYSVWRLVVVTTLGVVTIFVVGVEPTRIVAGFCLVIIVTILAFWSFWPGCERYDKCRTE